MKDLCGDSGAGAEVSVGAGDLAAVGDGVLAEAGVLKADLAGKRPGG